MTDVMRVFRPSCDRQLADCATREMESEICDHGTIIMDHDTVIYSREEACVISLSVSFNLIVSRNKQSISIPIRI